MERNSLLLSLQRAMLGNVTPNMQAITIKYKSGDLKLKVYFKDDPSDEEIDLLKIITSEVLADFEEIIKISEDYETTQNMAGKLICLDEWVYLQKI